MSFTFNKMFLLGLFSTALLSGCEEPAKSVEWYKDHQTEMNKKWEECKASGDDTQNCRNAIQAHFQIQQLNAPIPDLNNLDKVPVDPKLTIKKE